jgi:hypothetical protein
MHSESRKLLNEMLKHFSDMDYVHPEDIPNIDLYVDQVTTFIDSQLTSVKRDPQDKTLTKTMINNYTKNHVLPSPDKKKYSRDHVLTLIFIYYFKSFLSIKDIQEILNPITDRYFGKDSDLSFFDVYCQIVSLESTEARALVKDTIDKYNTSRQIFSDAPEEDRELLQNFTFICLLGFDVYIKKMMIEEFIDRSRNTSGKSQKEEE